MTTDFDLLDSVYPLLPEELYRQWVVGRDASAFPGEWRHRTLNGWVLAAHPDACVCRLENENDDVLGWVMEPLLQTDAAGSRCPTEVVRLPGKTDDLSEAEIEKALYGRDASGHPDGTGLEGMWIAVVITKSLRRIYLAPTHSIVYAPEKGRAATSHNLLQPFKRDLELSRAFDPIRTGRFFSFGLTAFCGIHRLLPNHYLDLDNFNAVRHWPKAPPRPRSGSEAAAAMVNHGRHLVSGLVDGVEQIEVPLSAGNDSRAVLSLLRPTIAAGELPVQLFTSVGLDLGQRIDLQAARRLARIAGLPLDERPRGKHKAAPIRPLMENFARVGEARAGSFLSRPKQPLPPGEQESSQPKRLVLAGMAGETARAFHWGYHLPSRLDAEDLLEHVGVPVIPRTVAAAQRWFDGLPDFLRGKPADILDLAYVEQRLGCWEALSRYVSPGRSKVISFMTSGFCIETMLGLPQAYRQSGMLQRDIVAYGWPELLKVPINQATGMLFLEKKARGVAGRVKRLRHRLSSREVSAPDAGLKLPAGQEVPRASTT